MSENTQGQRLPKGWTVDLRPTEEGRVRWELFRHQGDSVSLVSTVGIQPTEMKALQAAVAAAIEQSEPPAPPAWMVEVARESAATAFSGVGLDQAAEYARTGKSDDIPSVTAAVRALRLALERRHVVEVRPVSSEEELLKAAREDAAQAVAARPFDNLAAEIRLGVRDGGFQVLSALQARRNMLQEWSGVAAIPAAPVRDRGGNLPVYAPGDRVQKCTGDYQISGVVRGVILTGAGLWRYAVEHTAEGGGAFLHIYAGTNLSSLPTREA